MRQHRIHRRHSGVSLVELLVVMSAATVILTLSTGLIHRIMHAQTKARLLADVERTTLRLSNDVRRDVHQAMQATGDKAQLGEGVFLRLQLADGSTLEYRREETTIQRVHLEGSRTIAREEFVFDGDFELEAKVEDGRLVVLSVSSRGKRNKSIEGEPGRTVDDLPVDLQVVAAMGQGGAK
jgi:hypothetical protein